MKDNNDTSVSKKKCPLCGLQHDLDECANFIENKQPRSGPTQGRTSYLEVDQHLKEKERKKERKMMTGMAGNLKCYRNRDAVGFVSKFDISKLKEFHNTV